MPELKFKRIEDSLATGDKLEGPLTPLSSASSVASDDSRPSTPGTSFFYSGRYINLKERIHERIASKDIFFSLEFFPPRTANGAANLITRFEKVSF